MNIPDWILDPLSSANAEESPQLQEGLMGVPTNDEMKFKFKSGHKQFGGKKLNLKYGLSFKISLLHFLHHI